MPASTLEASKARLKKAVHRSSATSKDGLLERLFTFAFKGLVYPQIWEDPDVDMQALELKPHSRMVTISSGGCNVMSYLTADPAEITAVDLNRAHVALGRLKLAAAQHLPNYDSFYRFFGEADEKGNIAAYERFLKRNLDEESRAYWEGRDLTGWGRKRITLFSRDLYHHGLLGYCIGAGHFIAKLYGIDPKHFVRARTLDEQRSYFDTALAPLFDKRLVRWATSKKMSLYGLGIPPAQYEALVSASPTGSMSDVLKQRLQKLACDFKLSDNYFAWQAFNRGYAPNAGGLASAPVASGTGEAGPLPPYLRREHFETIRDRADRVTVINRSFTEHLEGQDEDSLDAYVLLDAQDWMTDDQLNALWSEITRTARPGARVIFRTAAEPTLLPGRVADDILDRWTYEEARSLELGRQDRSSIYGGFHLYVYNG
jgi:S-adenosylmethionine-diacylglycerol 3-amino-3-carboxypropyl transferase